MQKTRLLLREALSPLYEPREVNAIIRMLLEEICSLSYTQIVMWGDDPLPEPQALRLAECARLLSQGIPVQQVLGYTWFRGRRFSVNEHVLIPRPETEELVDKVVNNFGTTTQNTSGSPVDNPVYNLVDIGTGSGCIALSLAAEIHSALITAVDLSTEALMTAKENAKSLGLSNVRFVQADILREEYEDFSTELSTPGGTDINNASTLSPRCWDAIVSNPPYICHKEAVDISANVLEHEPHLALFVPDDDPLLFYRAIARYGTRHLKPGGGLYFEINAAYGTETCHLLEEIGYTGIELHQDFTGRDRMVTARYDC